MITFSRAKTCTKSILTTLSEHSSDKKFDSLWKVASKKQTQLDLEPPTSPRHCRIPHRIDDLNAQSEQYSSIEEYFLRCYYMLDILIKERFSDNSFSILSASEALLLDSFNCIEPKLEHLSYRSTKFLQL